MSVARQIINNERGFGRSENDDDWLGHGIYFWEYAPRQAFLWAKQRQRQRQRLRAWGEEVAVVASMIRLGFCYDLLDPENVKDLGRYHQAYDRAVKGATGPPSNVMSRKRLNCAVFNFTYQWLEDEGTPVDTCRAVFVPTQKADRIWPGSGINAHAHIQICVRNPECIPGTRLVKPIEEAEHVEQETDKEESVVRRDDPPLGTGNPGGDSREVARDSG